MTANGIVKREQEAMQMTAAHQAARNLEQAFERHGIESWPEVVKPRNPIATGMAIELSFSPAAANTLADWLNEQADEQRPLSHG